MHKLGKRMAIQVHHMWLHGLHILPFQVYLHEQQSNHGERQAHLQSPTAWKRLYVQAMSYSAAFI